MLSFFQLPKHRVFEYQPRYYDPEKERREQRRKELALEQDAPADNAPGSLLRSGAMRARHAGFQQEMEDDTRRSLVRRVTLMFVLGTICYLLLSGYLETILTFFMSAK